MKITLLFLTIAFCTIGCGAVPEEDVTSTTWRGDSSQTNNEENDSDAKGDTGQDPENKAVSRSLAIVTKYAQILNTSEISRSSEGASGITYTCKILDDHSLQCSRSDGSEYGSENLADLTNLVAGETQTCGLFKNQSVLCWDNPMSNNDEIAANPANLDLASAKSQNNCELSTENSLLCWDQRE